MSCYHPITIRNPKLVKNNVYDRSMIEVPCGHCVACKDTKRLAWFVRLFYEWKYCEKCGGFALYETLTYNNEHLPNIYGIPCFSTQNIKLYLKKVRSKLDRMYKSRGIDVTGKVKYYCSMEFGGKTHRPHMHIVFFVSSPDIQPFTFKFLVEHYWHENGFTKHGKINCGFVCNQGGLSYCSKYVCKDIYEDSYFRSVARRLEKMGLTKEDYNQFFPHSMQSTNLGIYALECDNHLNDLDDFLKGNIKLEDKNLGVRSYKLPLYYERKIFYNIHYRYFDNDNNCYRSVLELSKVPAGCDYSPFYVLNELGMEMIEVRAKDKKAAVENVYNIVQSLPELPTLLKKLNEKFNTSFETLKDFQKHIYKTLPKDYFVAYSLVYRGCKPIEYRSPSPCGNNNAYLDYLLIYDMSRGNRPLSVDFDNFCVNINEYHSIPMIEEHYKMIRYLYFLVHLEMETIFNEKERLYVEQKTAHLARTENILLTS